MTHQGYEFEPPERFVAGRVGSPGERTFYLQAGGGGRLVSVALEKVQVSLLAEKLDELLVEANRRFGLALPEIDMSHTDNEPLDNPIEEEFRVGTLGLAYDVDTSTIVIEAIAVGEATEEDSDTDVEVDLDDEAGPTDEELDATADLDRLRVRLTPAETRA